MAYTAPYYGGYQPYYAPAMPDQLAQLRQAQFQQPVQQPAQPQPASSGINWVQGEEGAKAFLTVAGSSVLLMDSENSTFYIKSSDASGMPLPLRIFDYTERTSAPKTPQVNVSMPSEDFITRSEFEALEAKINGFMAEKTKTTKKPPAKEEMDNA